MEKYYKYPWVIFKLNKERYGVATPHVVSMVAMPDVTKTPGAPEYIRGAIEIRDQITPLIDLRQRLGMSSFLDKIRDQISMLKQREHDHRNWLSELESSVKKISHLNWQQIIISVNLDNGMIRILQNLMKKANFEEIQQSP